MIWLIFTLIIGCVFSLPAWNKDLSFSDPLELANLISDISNFDSFGLGNDPSPCCLPKQWQGIVKSVMGLNGGRGTEEESVDRRGKGKVAAQTLILYVDETNKRIAGKSICPVTKAEWFSFILHFKNDKGAILNLFNTTAKNCKTFSLKEAEFKDQCIPNDARFIGAFKIGTAVGGLDVKSFTYNRTTRRAILFENTVVTPDTCLPIVSHAVGKVCSSFFGLPNLNLNLGEGEEPNPRPTGLNFVASSFFYNLQASISDPSVFNPPSYCPTEKALVFKKLSPSLDDISNFMELYK